MSLRTPLGKVRGLGSAKDGTSHFWVQRVTAVALVPLIIWFIYTLLSLVGASYEDARAALAAPGVAVPMLLLLAAGFYHLKLGLQVVIEDYVSNDGLRIVGLIVNNLGCAALGIACVYSVLKIGFGG